MFQVDISDALSEKDKVPYTFFLLLFFYFSSSNFKLFISSVTFMTSCRQVKFTVHTKTSMPEFQKNEFSVIRLHEDFIWLHDDIRGERITGKNI